MEGRLIKTDRNGTKTYQSNVCRKCGGSGYLSGYEFIDGARCWRCGTTGRENTYTWVVRTPEYEAVLAERRRKKMLAEAPAKNLEFFKRVGFSEDGRTWVVMGDCFSIKDELKAAGAKYDPSLGWHFDRADNGFPCFEISIDEVGELSDLGTWSFYPPMVADVIKRKREEKAPKTESEYVGEVGQKLSAKVTLVKIHSYTTHFTYYGGTAYIFKFKDEQGNTLVWRTASPPTIDEGKTYTITGTVKAHSEYRGDKQTELTRCKVVLA